jgi:hypothetical protein
MTLQQNPSKPVFQRKQPLAAPAKPVHQHGAIPAVIEPVIVERIGTKQSAAKSPVINREEKNIAQISSSVHVTNNSKNSQKSEKRKSFKGTKFKLPKQIRLSHNIKIDHSQLQMKYSDERELFMDK